MTYTPEIKPSCKRSINKACKKNPVLRKALTSKMREIVSNPLRYKPLRYDLAGERRVHILKSFVLVFEINHANRKVIFLKFRHHDEVYRK